MKFPSTNQDAVAVIWIAPCMYLATLVKGWYYEFVEFCSGVCEKENELKRIKKNDHVRNFAL